MIHSNNINNFRTYINTAATGDNNVLLFNAWQQAGVYGSLQRRSTTACSLLQKKHFIYLLSYVKSNQSYSIHQNTICHKNNIILKQTHLAATEKGGSLQRRATTACSRLQKEHQVLLCFYVIINIFYSFYSIH